MTDTVDKATRSRIMAAVPTRDTSIEMKVRRALYRAASDTVFIAETCQAHRIWC